MFPLQGATFQRDIETDSSKDRIYVLRLRFQQAQQGCVNEERGRERHEKRKKKEVGPEGAGSRMKFSIRALKARGGGSHKYAMARETWGGKVAHKFSSRCRFLVITDQAKFLVLRPTPVIFRERTRGNEIPRFLRYFAPKNTPVPSSCRTNSPPSLSTALLEGALNYVRNKQHRMLATNSRASISQYIPGVTKRFP